MDLGIFLPSWAGPEAVFILGRSFGATKRQGTRYTWYTPLRIAFKGFTYPSKQVKWNENHRQVQYPRHGDELIAKARPLDFGHHHSTASQRSVG